MRFAALAFGVLAGLVASLILALGGLDPSALAHFDPRQVSLVRFGLFVVANFGVLGAGVVLAAPLGGAVLFVVGAIAWILAALVLRHGPDYVLITPPALLLIAFAFGLVDWLRRDRRASRDYYDEEGLPPIRAAMADQESDEAEPQEEYDEEPAGTQVRAGFFGQGGTATPARVEAGLPPQPALHSAFDDEDDYRGQRADDWRPGSRKPPPRQQPMFRQPDDDYDEEESGWSRFARLFSSFVSFGLYAALAGAAVLIFWNLRNTDHATPSAATVDARSSEVATAAPSAPLLASSSAPAQVVAVAEPPSLPAANLITAAPTLADTPMVAPGPATLANTPPSEPVPSPGGLVAGETPPPMTPALTSLAPPAPAAPAIAEAPAGGDQVTPTVGTPQNPMPFPMSTEMAAERARPAPRPTTPPRASAPATPRTTAPATSNGDAGL